MSTGSWSRAALVAGWMLVASLLSTCTLSTAIPPGAQQVRLVGSHTEVRLDPPTVHAGDIYFVVEGTGALLIQKSGAPGEEGPFTDAELAHLAQAGDLFHTSMLDLTVGYAGNVRKLTLGPGKYAPPAHGRGRIRGRGPDGPWGALPRGRRFLRLAAAAVDGRARGSALTGRAERERRGKDAGGAFSTDGRGDRVPTQRRQFC